MIELLFGNDKAPGRTRRAATPKLSSASVRRCTCRSPDRLSRHALREGDDLARSDDERMCRRPRGGTRDPESKVDHNRDQTDTNLISVIVCVPATSRACRTFHLRRRRSEATRQDNRAERERFRSPHVRGESGRLIIDLAAALACGSAEPPRLRDGRDARPSAIQCH